MDTKNTTPKKLHNKVHQLIIKGVELLELLASNGILAPSWDIRDFLKAAHPHERAWALVWAQQKELENAQQLLREAGADLLGKDNNGDTILHHAVASSNLDTVRFLLEIDERLASESNKSKENPLHVAAKIGVDECLSILAETSNIRAQSHRGTPFQICLKSKNLYGLKVLLEHGANVNRLFRNGKLPLHCAVFDDFTQGAELLIKHGVNVNALNRDGDSALSLSIILASPKMTQILIQGGANVNHIGQNSCNLLYRVAFLQPRSHLAILQMMVDAGANVNQTSGQLGTPLHAAVLKRCAPAVDILLKAGADLSIKDYEGGETPLDVAKRCKHKECANMLIRFKQIRSRRANAHKV